nr:MAG TPA: Phosphoribosyl-ATP pyrophosphatase [Microviridae sp.]
MQQSVIARAMETLKKVIRKQKNLENQKNYVSL